MIVGCTCDPPPRRTGEQHKKGCMWAGANPKPPSTAPTLGGIMRRVAIDFTVSNFATMLAETLPPGAVIVAGVGGLAVSALPKGKRRAALAKLLRDLADQCDKEPI